MDNAHCILVEFVNEENSVAVGYRDWLKTKFDDVCLQSTIDKETIVQIRWPLCEIKSALSMKRIIKKLKEKDWISAAVKIHAFGERREALNCLTFVIIDFTCREPVIFFIINILCKIFFSKWTLMHKQLFDLQKFNIANPCKEDRKKVMRKSFSDSDCVNSDQENKVPKKKNTKLFSSPDESDETSFTDDSCESSKKNLNRSHLEEKVKALQLKNKQLQNEVTALKHDRSITLENKMENLDKMADKLAVKLQDIKKHIAEINKNISAQVFQKQQTYPNVKFVKEEDPSNDDQIKYNFVSIINTEHDDKSSSIDIDKKFDEIVMDVLDCKEVKELEQCDEMHKIISIGRGVTISESMMQNVRTSDIGKMTCDLMSCIFTNKEMAFSSRTGKKSNKTKTGENVTNDNKKPLDSNKLLAMKDYVLSQFKNTPNGEKLFNNTVSNKCKNVARSYK
ncbi:uncharacterized protein [Temnothorax nylanderi]|uniref:uncharacterized protein n=1 Tax=Temnothorax nylanderi TaxID=102681 RepID=UPI003A8C1A2E